MFVLDKIISGDRLMKWMVWVFSCGSFFLVECLCIGL